MRREADEPGIQIVIRRARLTRSRERETRLARAIRRAVVDDVLQHARHQVGGRFADRLPAFAGRLIEHVAVAVLDAADHRRLTDDALGGEGAVSRGERNERHVAGAERHGGHAWRGTDVQLLCVANRILDAHAAQQLDGGAVARGAQRGAQRHLRRRRVLVLRHPVPLHRLDRIVQPRDHRRRAVSRFDRRSIDERLERGARLTLRLSGAIETALVKVAAAHHREDVPGRRIDGYQRALEILGKLPFLDRSQFLPCRIFEGPACLDLRHALFDERLGRLLQLRMHRRVDLQAALIHALPAESLDQVAADLFLEIEAEGLGDFERVLQLHVLAAGSVGCLLVDGAGRSHRGEHHVAPRDRSIEVHRGRVAGWGLDQSGEQRRAADRQV